MEEVRTLAFLLRARAYGESDTIAVLLTSDHGKISGIARGARRSRRRFAGAALQPFHELTVRYKRRAHSELMFLEESQVEAGFDSVAASVDAFAWASYVTELADVVLPPAESCAPVYALYRATLDRLARGAAATPCCQHFALRLLEHAGWCPDFEHCGICGSALDVATQPIVDPRGGGVICSRHDAERGRADADEPGYRPSRRVIDPALLNHMRASRTEPQPNGSPDTVTAATLLLDRLIALHVPRALKTRRVLADLTAPP